MSSKDAKHADVAQHLVYKDRNGLKSRSFSLVLGCTKVSDIVQDQTFKDSLSAQDAGLLKSVEVPEYIAPVSQAFVSTI